MAAFSSVRRFLITIISAAMRPSMTTPSTPTNTPTRVNICGLSWEAFFPSASETERGHTDRTHRVKRLQTWRGRGRSLLNELYTKELYTKEKITLSHTFRSCKWYTIHIPSLEFYIPLLNCFNMYQNIIKLQNQNVFLTFSQPYNVSSSPLGRPK